ncbi:MAG: hypothetical protein M3N41_04465, partial [Acidobacteriota bacterium]|nr:hypothetical protein [Acidobacteriota bacterium]
MKTFLLAPVIVLITFFGLAVAQEGIPGSGRLQEFGEWKPDPHHQELMIRVRCEYFDDGANQYVWGVQLKNVSGKHLNFWWDIDKHLNGTGHQAGGMVDSKPGEVTNAPINFSKNGPTEKLEVRITKIQDLTGKDRDFARKQVEAQKRAQKLSEERVAAEKKQAIEVAKNEAKAEERERKRAARAENPGGGFWNILGAVVAGAAQGVAAAPPPPSYPAPVPTN